MRIIKRSKAWLIKISIILALIVILVIVGMYIYDTKFQAETEPLIEINDTVVVGTGDGGDGTNKLAIIVAIFITLLILTLFLLFRNKIQPMRLDTNKINIDGQKFLMKNGYVFEGADGKMTADINDQNVQPYMCYSQIGYWGTNKNNALYMMGFSKCKLNENKIISFNKKTEPDYTLLYMNNPFPFKKTFLITPKMSLVDLEKWLNDHYVNRTGLALFPDKYGSQLPTGLSLAASKGVEEGVKNIMAERVGR